MSKQSGQKLSRWVIGTGVFLATISWGGVSDASDRSETPDPIERVRELRLRGSLVEAQALAHQELQAKPDFALEVELRVELARVLDRVGLHQNSRPVAAALEQIDRAAVVVSEAGQDSSESPALQKSLAIIEQVRAEYLYRAEMAEREFPQATVHANRAIEMFEALGDKYGEAEAVHRLGLIHMQRRELDLAKELFDRSLELDQMGGERLFFRGEYERHVGFVYLLGGQTETALPYFERSLDVRRRAGAVDASLFAANTLASALVDLGRLDRARQPLLYAMTVADRLNSPSGQVRNALVLGQLFRAEGDLEAARLALENALGVAESINYESGLRRAREGLEAIEVASDTSNH